MAADWLGGVLLSDWLVPTVMVADGLDVVGIVDNRLVSVVNGGCLACVALRCDWLDGTGLVCCWSNCAVSVAIRPFSVALLCGRLAGAALVVDCLDVSGIVDERLADGDWLVCVMLPGNWLADGVVDDVCSDDWSERFVHEEVGDLAVLEDIRLDAVVQLTGLSEDVLVFKAAADLWRSFKEKNCIKK